TYPLCFLRSQITTVAQTIATNSNMQPGAIWFLMSSIKAPATNSISTNALRNIHAVFLLFLIIVRRLYRRLLHESTATEENLKENF
ncbi:MAG TPA: hypothetical protein VEG28_04040, partial [Dehalococcoidia bacterium]|nr:hypothetical protein [Dehalococcoidia bacterium]